MNLQGGEILISRKAGVKTYEIVSPMLDPGDDDEWIIREGKQEMQVLIHDLDFLEAVQEGLVFFTHGCLIECRMQETRWMTPEGIRTEYRIKEVIRIRNPEDDLCGGDDGECGAG